MLIGDHPAVRKGVRRLLSQEVHMICGERRVQDITRDTARWFWKGSGSGQANILNCYS